MIHEAYMPVYMGSRFLARTDGTGRTEVVQEALADLKTTLYIQHEKLGVENTLFFLRKT